MKNIRKSIIQVVLLNGASVFFQLLSIFLWSKIGASHVGIIALFELCSSMLIAIGFFGGEQGYIVATNKNKVHPSLLFHFGYMLAVFVLFLLLYPFVGIGPGLDDLTAPQSLMLLGSAFIVSASQMFVAKLRASGHVVGAAYVEKCWWIAFGCVSFAMFFHDGLSSAFFFEVFFLSSIILVLVCLIVHYSHSDADQSSSSEQASTVRPHKANFDNNSIILYVTTIFVLVYERIDQFVIAGLFSVSVLGAYFTCYKIAFSARVLIRIVNTNLFPFLSKKMHSIDGGSPAELSRLLAVNSLTNRLLSGLFALPVAAFPGAVLSIFGAEFLPFDWVLVFMAFLLVVSVPNQVRFNALAAAGKSNWGLINSLITVTAQLLVIVILTKSMGIAALLVAKLVAVLIGNQLSYLAAKREGLHDSDFFMNLRFVSSFSLLCISHQFDEKALFAAALVWVLFEIQKTAVALFKRVKRD